MKKKLNKLEEKLNSLRCEKIISETKLLNSSKWILFLTVFLNFNNFLIAIHYISFKILA